MYKVLDTIETPADVRNLSPKDLELLCREIREYMVDCCSRNPGHLASSLGAVELIVGLHYLYNTPTDKLVFDVGHQAYAHKIICGRREAFKSLRAEGGISGFPKISESGYDAFGVGHSSTSISAALGMAEAARLRGAAEKVIAFIGDGALTGGLAFEGLNNAGSSKADILVILNDNNQSIDPNRGGLHEYLLKVTTSEQYNRVKKGVWNILGEGKLRSFIQRWIKSLKSWFVKSTGGDLFESLGFRYFGPIDGNDMDQVLFALKKLKGMSGPCILHCITRKGKGYAPAEADPVVWHAPGKFNPATGERLVVERKADRYQDVFGKTLCELAEMDERVVGVTPAMATGCGMTEFAARYPARFFDVGIEEEHAVTFSAGMAANGLRPFCNIYSAFSQRAYDQIIHDVALQKLPVVLCFDRAGLVGEDGATHNGVFDMAAYRSIPGCVVCAPSNEKELRNMMYSALKATSGPYIIRYPRGMGEGVDWKDAPFETIASGKAVEFRKGQRIAVIAVGPVVNRALEAVKMMEESGSDAAAVGVYDFRFIKPLDEEMLEYIAGRYETVLTVEDGCLKGGFFGAVTEYYASAGRSVRVAGIGVPDEFVPHSRQADQRKKCGMDAEGICRKILELSV